tara:strand:- start:907 stop:1056 length:150 start_codon:yes stop_codon:yes gene_type:complete
MPSETIDYRTLVAEAEGTEYPNYQHDAYEFSKKTFEEDDRSGVYNDNPN